MRNEFFPRSFRIPCEGPESDSPYAFKFYNPDKVVAGNGSSR